MLWVMKQTNLSSIISRTKFFTEPCQKSAKLLLTIASTEFPLWSLNSFSNVNDAKLSFNDRVFLSEQSVTCHSALRQCTAATATTITSRSAIRLIPLRSARKWNSPDRKNGEFWRTSASCRRLSWFNSQPFRCVGFFHSPVSFTDKVSSPNFSQTFSQKFTQKGTANLQSSINAKDSLGS